MLVGNSFEPSEKAIFVKQIAGWTSAHLWHGFLAMHV